MKLEAIEKEIRSYAQDISCTKAEECQWSMTGTRACGGPRIALPYSTKNIDETLMNQKSQYLSNAENIFNTQYGIISDCMAIEPPAPMSCISNLCQ
jgi:hypothetical protein